jgi:hypothetical protein
MKTLLQDFVARERWGTDRGSNGPIPLLPRILEKLKAQATDAKEVGVGEPR